MTKRRTTFVRWRPFVTFVGCLLPANDAFAMAMAPTNPALEFRYYVALTRDRDELALLCHE